MPKSDFGVIQDHLAELFRATEEIKKLLTRENDLVIDDWEEIDNLYQKRAEILALIDIWRSSDDGKEIILKNSEIWDKVIKKIADIDIENLELIENNVKVMGDKLKQMTKQKSLLLYNRESIKWILNR